MTGIPNITHLARSRTPPFVVQIILRKNLLTTPLLRNYGLQSLARPFQLQVPCRSSPTGRLYPSPVPICPVYILLERLRFSPKTSLHQSSSTTVRHRSRSSLRTEACRPQLPPFRTEIVGHILRRSRRLLHATPYFQKQIRSRFYPLFAPTNAWAALTPRCPSRH